MTLMTQCRLRTQDGRTTDGFIESRGAVVGKWVDVKGEDERFEVVSAHTELPGEYVYENERNHKSHRNATDI